LRVQFSFSQRLFGDAEMGGNMVGKLAAIAALVGMAGLSIPALQAQEDTPDRRLRAAAATLSEIMRTPDKGIPDDLLRKAQCVVIIPGMKKGAFIFGADYGRGYAVCRHNGRWGAPAAVRIGGGSFGAQIGVESTDVVLLVMNQRGMDRLASDKFTIGADASAAAGPVGRTAAADTDATMRAEILSWSRSHGVFAGVSLDGTVISKDDGEDKKLYGEKVSNHAIINGEVPPPPAAHELIAELNHYSPGRKS
jgi:lipid-binding SYLF domain-containing protein